MMSLTLAIVYRYNASMAQKTKASLHGELSLINEQKVSLSNKQVELLRAVKEAGSITAAARLAGISYKTAWDRIDDMNNMSRQPLVLRKPGGKGGGGSRLSRHGEALLAGFDRLRSQHHEFVNRLGVDIHEMEDVAQFVQAQALRSSARNQYIGKVEKVSRSDVSAEVAIRLSDELTLISVVTRQSARDLGLRKGREVIALIKASQVLLSSNTEILTSARNKLTGTVSKITPGKINAEVIMSLGEEKTLCAVITNDSLNALKISKGDRICAFFKASSIILLAT